ncbi:hypothetical protein FJU08_11445 [Martelella alba]|uniref:Uncharacterized protein n=1 Tax=Martelella alba TaxID=2590451 RepID=A0A506UB27_9HYPH|nr:DUF6492 family protein [Martelella alba]TPW30576.1 hypothetical protein FJU08_11445 [Martelella alba]
MIDTLVSVCSARDIKVWRFTAKMAIKYIKARRYCVIVPDDAVELFRQESPEAYDVIAEGPIAAPYLDMLRDAVTDAGSKRFGWYLQQLLKISFSARCDDDALVVIWDADTVPLAPLDFTDEAGRLLIYKSDEFHQPYFDNIERLTGMKRRVSHSFIAQCLPFRAVWLKTLLSDIAQGSGGLNPEQAIIHSIDFRENSGFSEYELIGTYMDAHHRAAMAYSNRRWTRDGYRLFVKPEFTQSRAARLINRGYDFVAFEGWNKPGRSQRRRRRILLTAARAFLG